MVATQSLSNLKEEQKGDVLILRISGRLDTLSSPVAEKKIFDAINNGHYKLLIDLSGVTYLSSAGMRMFLSTTKKLKTLSGKMVLSGMAPNVMDVLKISGFDHILQLYKVEEEALRYF